MPELSDYERGARDMQERAAKVAHAWLTKWNVAGEFAEQVMGADVSEGVYQQVCTAISDTLRDISCGIEALPLTPPASPETESKDGE